MERGILYRGPGRKIGECLCPLIIGGPGKCGAQQQDEGLWKTQRAILRRPKTRIGVHGCWRGRWLIVYSAGDRGAGVREGDGQDGCTERDQWKRQKRIVLGRLAMSGRCLGRPLTVGCGHFGDTGDVLLRSELSLSQPEGLYDG